MNGERRIDASGIFCDKCNELFFVFKDNQFEMEFNPDFFIMYMCPRCDHIMYYNLYDKLSEFSDKALEQLKPRSGEWLC